MPVSRISLWIAAAALLAAAACTKKTPGTAPLEPARQARAGCSWQEFRADSLGVRMLVEQCAQPSAAFRVQANTIVMTPTGGAPVPLVEVFAKRDAQPATAAIREQFVSRLDDGPRRGCIVKFPVARIKPAPKGVETYEIAPGPDYAPKAKGPLPCGEYGAAETLTFFLGQRQDAPGRFVFVHADVQPPAFDPLSVRLVPENVVAPRLLDLPIENLPTAELAALAMERDLKRYRETQSQFRSDDADITLTAFLDSGAPAILVEHRELGDLGSSSVRYYFRQGALFLVRDNGLRVPDKGMANANSVLLTRLAFAPGGKLLEGRKVIDGAAQPIDTATDVDAVLNHVKELLKRVAR
jgi:hypothetical protein